MKYYLLKTVSYIALFAIIPATAGAETVLTNANGYTSTAWGLQQFSTMVIGDDGKILAVGGEDLPGDQDPASVIDVGGRTILPGLIDAHAHVYGLGFAKSTLDLVGVQSRAAATKRIGDYAERNPNVRWIQGRGWNQVLWPVQKFPTAADIDAVVSDRPVWLRRIDGHAGWANSAALRIAGIDDDTPDPVGGKIIRDQHGHATGVLIDTAMSLVGRHTPEPDKDDYRRAIKTAIDSLVAEGITGVHDAGVGLPNVEVYLSMADMDELNLRIYAMLRGAGDVLDAVGKPLRGLGDDRLDITAIKLFADGALGSRGAALLEPYSDDAENRGLAFWTEDELNAFVAKANGMGFQVGIHAIGDRGNRMALDAFARAQGGERSTLRNRVEHAQIIALDDIPRFAALGVIASMQPTHATSDKNMAEDRVGPERIRGGYAWRRLLDSGAVIASGSDFPVELSNPFHGLYAAISRQDRDGQPAGGWYPDQALTRIEALHSFTLAAAYAAHQEDRLGSLEPGKWADFIVIDRDYFEVPVDEIDDIRVLQTWVGGKRVFDAAAEALPQ
ncbi:MAG: amidohydrolase [Woeseiaceae bacterium]